MEKEPLIHWPQPIIECLGFIAVFFSVGAVGFRTMVLGRLGLLETGPAEERAIFDRATRRAAAIGLTGVLIGLVLTVTRLPQMAARKHTNISHLAVHDPATAVQLGVGL